MFSSDGVHSGRFRSSKWLRRCCFCRFASCSRSLGGKFQPLSHGKRKKNVLRLLRMLALARRLYDFSNNLHDSFFIPHFKEGGFFYFHSCSLFSYLRLLLLSCGCFLCVSCFGGESTIKKSLSWFWSTVKATIDLLFKRHSNGVFIWTEKK